ncbi:MAG: mandelate racemase/muconate lactonizing enzyme family protein [Chloroflexi bacterium]|nr:mandelate racemase/muconate lactonizing enzyme family protein [Chloroflexota bacterium]MCL5274297.1 mandelate racemase/muconate lactonizing enzyme family protein [Chloroflexota bacterium]
MKITAIKTAATSGHGMHLWVRVETDEGISGIGECVHGGVQAIAIIHEIRHHLIGRDPFRIDALFEEVRRSHVFDGGFAGALITALTGIELALWDLKGKAMRAPVYELLGGKFRDKIRVYADCQVDPGMDLSEVKQVVDGVLERGFTALKIDVDGGDPHKDPFNYTASEREQDQMLQLIDMTVSAAGKDIAVAADVHTRLDMPSAIRLAKACEHYQLMWLEEPVPPENIDAMREITRSTTTPICAGENLYLRHGFRDLITRQAVDVIMPDIPKCGGLSECRKIANLAEIYYIPFAPHNVASPIGTMASCHVCATVPNFLVIEFHWLQRDYWSTIITDKEDIIKHGYITPSDRPGIGLELDETVARQYQYPGTTWFE